MCVFCCWLLLLLVLLLQMLSGHVARAGHWLSAAASLVSSLSQQAEASLQLEYSRRGRLWAPGGVQLRHSLRRGRPALVGRSAAWCLPWHVCCCAVATASLCPRVSQSSPAYMVGFEGGSAPCGFHIGVEHAL